ncbi:hypothetical protein PtrSN002B_010254 [Pyrenophora tritici-repentis]|uniref:Uncharacterized protein n=1 Tax=Pyrenophora tritici-repentis TaxID=45151 RepID=A0A2W1DM47_9PLEO|nr:hypothetical protein PtrM4_111750 [Pyrenophora tritici-repentis]KAG9384223.1 hypothetical protein A1F94_006134 [Pyrenophora tritici-repentis]KAI0570944.1 hypothetical protein Alg215_10735 [Pyrenophora tritici-repentis]KAI0572907.1 hypothetical protein Alg130_10306 [Pyrenophora tritici-repentis]KAI0608404.1 hypothetical protein TUN205_07348 [Pyrenophora tritici-repentis]
MPKPPPELTLIDTNEAEVESNSQDTVQSPLTPMTPTTVASLEKNIQKMSKAAHLAFSKGILQRDQIQFLMKINDESKVRRSAKEHMLGRRVEKGEGAVIGWNELEVARAKRAEQAAATAARSTRKRRRKRKGTAGGEPQAKVARQSDRQSEVQVESQVASSWRAPEAPMLHNRRV